ncbi:MAG: proteic killer suppression protein, partial [Pseudohongiellaceae bacterium]
MIESFRDDSFSRYYWDGEGDKGIPSNIKSALNRKLDLIHSAEAACDLRVPPGNKFEHLKGKLNGWCSIRVNKQYRLIFQWNAGRAA